MRCALCSTVLFSLATAVPIGCSRPGTATAVAAGPLDAAPAPDAAVPVGPRERVPTAVPPPPLRADALELIGALAAGAQSLRMLGDEVTDPAAFGQLVRMGADALPSVFAVAETTRNGWIRHLLLDVAARIGDARAREPLEQFLRSPDPAARDAAVAALGRLGLAGSRPALRATLASAPPDRCVAVLDALLRTGDDSVLPALLRAGREDPEQRFSAAQALLRHAPLRRALGFAQPYAEGSFEFVEDELLLPAADEWYREQVLRQASPWRYPTLAALAQPRLAEKQAALQLLLDGVAAGNDAWSCLRVRGVDPAPAAGDERQALTLVTGSGHGGDLRIVAWQPEPDRVVGHCFAIQTPSLCARATHEVFTYSRLTSSPADYRALRIGLHTVLAAELVPWWSGPECGSLLSSYDFTVSIAGVGEIEPLRRRFCGYRASHERIHYERLLAAVAWHAQVTQRATTSAAELEPEARARFAAVLRAHLPPATDDDYWWVHERLVAMARHAGDVSVAADLAPFLEARYAEGEHSRRRLAEGAVDALATILGVDLRRSADGTPLPLAVVATEYRRLLRR